MGAQRGRHRAVAPRRSMWPPVILAVITVAAITTLITAREDVSDVHDTSLQTPTAVDKPTTNVAGDGLLTPHPVWRTTTTVPPPPPTTTTIPPPAEPIPANTPFSPPPPPLPAPGTSGVGWQAMWAVVHAQFPDAWLASGYRTSNCGQYHCIGLAIDIGAPTSARMQEIDAWIAATYPQSSQLIHTPGPVNLLNGLAFVYDVATQNDHYDHVHWAMEGSV